MSTPASTAAVASYGDMTCVDRSIPPGSRTADTSVAHQSFETGECGISLVGPYIMSRFDKSMGKGAFDVVAMPPGTDGDVVLAEGESLYLSQGSRNRAAQESFAAFATSKEGHEIGMSPGQHRPDRAATGQHRRGREGGPQGRPLLPAFLRPRPHRGPSEGLRSVPSGD